MESNVKSYKLDNYYIKISIFGNSIKIVLKNSLEPASEHTRSFTLEDFRKIDNLFNTIQNLEQIIHLIDSGFKNKLVKVVEVGASIRIVTQVFKHGVPHQVDFPISEKGAFTFTKSSTNKLITRKTTTQTQYLKETGSNEIDPRFSIEIGLDPSKVARQSINANTAEIIKSIQDQQNINLQNLNTTKIDLDKIQIPPIEQTSNVNLGADILSTAQNNNIQEASTQLNIEEYKATSTPEITTQDTSAQFNFGEYQATTSTQNITTQDTTAQFNYGEYQATTSTPEITTQDTTAQLNLGEYQATSTPEITTQDTSAQFNFGEYKSTSTTEITTQDTSAQFNFGEYQATSSTPEITTQDTSAQFNFGEYQATSSTPEITTQDTSAQFNFGEYQATSTPEITTQDTSAQFNFGEYKSTSTTEMTTQYNVANTFESNPISVPVETGVGQTTTTTTTNTYSAPYITPADDLGQTDTGYNQANYGEYQSTTNTNYDTQNFANIEIKPNVQDDRLNKLEGETSNLKNEHEQIHNKLITLSSQVNSYKNQLELLEKEKTSSELSSLRAENAAIKQQLSELKSLRSEASDVTVLRSQLLELEALRRKASEMDSLKGQLNELTALRAKVAELSGLKNQLDELNSLKAQVSQINSVRMNDLNMLREKVDKLFTSKFNTESSEKEILKQKVEDLEGLNAQYEQEIRSLRQSSKVQESEFEKRQHIFQDKTQNITVKGDIIHSIDELELLTRKMNKNNNKITLNLIYKATTDSDKAQAFHEKCDEAQSTLVLVETDKGKRFGGFTTCSWAGDCEEKKDADAFVFSLDKMQVYENIPSELAIGCYPNFGPIFLGCQIRIYDHAFTKGGTTYEKGLNFNTEEDYELTGGDKNFNVKEIEVYEVIA